MLLASATRVAKAAASNFDVFRFVPGYSRTIVAPGKEPVLLLLLAFLVTFALTRAYTRLARIRGWGSGSFHGVHVHHMVVGIVIVLATGIVAVATWPTGVGREILGICFGIGAALTLDEFALSLYLKDVYWSPEGRSSVDATVAGVMFAGLLMVGISPFGVHEGQGPRLILFAIVALNVFLAAATFLKGKLMLGLVSIFIPVAGLLGVLRLAKPHSPWARWFYKHDDVKLERSRARYDDDRGWGVRFNIWFTDLVGGSPSKTSPTD